MKTATGASQVYDIDYTSALLGQNVDQDDSNATQPQEEEVCATIFKKCCFHSMFTWLLITFITVQFNLTNFESCNNYANKS